MDIRPTRLCRAAVLLLSAVAAHAGDGPDISAEATLVSDYRFRGVSLSDLDPAPQIGLTATAGSGFYAGAWASTITEIAAGANVEIDLYAGYVHDLGGGVSLDSLATWYLYPGDGSLDYAELSATLRHASGPATLSAAIAYAPKQGALRDGLGAKTDNVYFSTGLDWAVGETPVTLSATLGRERGAFDFNPAGGKWDWSAGASYKLGDMATLGLSYIDSNIDVRSKNNRHNVAGAGVVASATLAF